MRRLALVLAAVVVAGAGCSGTGHSAAETIPSTDALVSAARAYQTAMLHGDGARVWDFWSEHCQDAGNRADLIHHVSNYEAFWKGHATTVDDVKAHRDPGDARRATVTYSVGGERNPEPEPWTAEDGKWKYDFCPASHGFTH